MKKLKAYCKICNKETDYEKTKYSGRERGDEPHTVKLFTDFKNGYVSVWDCIECGENRVSIVE